MNLPKHVRIREVGMRDGLQSRTQFVPTEIKVRMLRGLIAAGFKSINAVALVHPAAMPHLADAEEVLNLVGPVPGVQVSALVLNRKGLERATALRSAGLLDEVHFLHATTESVLRANGFQVSTARNQADVIDMARDAREAGLRTLAFVSASFGCSIEGYVDPAIPLRIAEDFKKSGVVDEVAFSDSSGQGTPRQIEAFFMGVRDNVEGPITVHFHDSRGSGLANALTLLQLGLENVTIDAAFAGLGGDVPFLPQAAGNLCTEDLVSMLDGCGVETDVDLGRVLDVAGLAQEVFEEPVPSRTLQVGPVPWEQPNPWPA